MRSHTQFEIVERGVVNIHGQPVTIQYIQYDENAKEFIYAKGVNLQTKQEFYFISASGNKVIDKRLNFSNFKKEKPNCVVVFNFKVPEGAVINLPGHAECYLVLQRHGNFTVKGHSHYNLINVETPEHVKKVSLLELKRPLEEPTTNQPVATQPAPQKKVKEGKDIFLESRRRWNELRILRNQTLSLHIIKDLMKNHRNLPPAQQAANNYYAEKMLHMNPCHLLPADRVFAPAWISSACAVTRKVHLIVTQNTAEMKTWIDELSKANVQVTIITPELLQLEPGELTQKLLSSPCWIVSQDMVDINTLDLQPFDSLLLDQVASQQQLPQGCQKVYFNQNNNQEKKCTINLANFPPREETDLFEQEYRQVQQHYVHSVTSNPVDDILENMQRNNTWPVSTIPPRPYQIKPMIQYFQARRSGLHAVFPYSTGSGKTFLFANLTGLTNDRVLIVVPRTNLVLQTIAAYKRFLPNVKVAKAVITYKKQGNIVPNINNPRIQVLVTTYQSLQKHFQQVDFSRFNALYLDEAHNSLSEARVNVVQKAKDAGVMVHAFTATPFLDVNRAADDDGLLDVYALCGFEADGSNCPIEPFTICQAIEACANVPVVMHHVMPNVLNNQEIKVRAGHDISEKVAAQMMDNDVCNLMLADLYLNGEDPVSHRQYRGQKGVVFCSGINHTKHVEECFDQVLLSNYKLTEADTTNIDRIYFEMEKKAYQKQNKLKKDQVDRTYEPGILWKDEQREKYYALAKAKAHRRLAVAAVDPDGSMRKRYADNIAADFHARTGRVLHKEDWQRAYDRFRVVKAVYSGNNNVENLGDAKCEKILQKFMLGGYLLLAGADKLTEGFDDPEVNLVFFARPTKSDKVMTQGVGRGLRVNSKDPDKVCTVFQLHMTKNIASYKMIHELISENLTPVFQYGKVDETRKRHAATKLPRLMIGEIPAYHLVSAPAEGTIYLPPIPPKQPSKKLTKKARKTGTRKATNVDTDTELQEQMSVIGASLDSVMEIFAKIKPDIAVEILTKPDRTEASEQKERKTSSAPAAMKRVRSDDDIPEEVTEFLNSTKEKLNLIKQTIDYYRSPAQQVASEKQNVNVGKTRGSEEMLATARGRVEGMMKRMQDLFNSKVVGLLMSSDGNEAIAGAVQDLQYDIALILNHLEPEPPVVSPPVVAPPVVKQPANVPSLTAMEIAVQFYERMVILNGENPTTNACCTDFLSFYLELNKGTILHYANNLPIGITFEYLDVIVALVELYTDRHQGKDRMMLEIVDGLITTIPSDLLAKLKTSDKFKYSLIDLFDNEAALKYIKGFYPQYVVKLFLNVINIVDKSDIFNELISSPLMHIMENNMDLLFLLFVAYEAKASDFNNQDCFVLNDPRYAKYVTVLLNGEAILDGRPLLSDIACMNDEMFNPIYQRGALNNQVALLKGQYEPNWGQIMASKDITLDERLSKLGFIENASLEYPDKINYDDDKLTKWFSNLSGSEATSLMKRLSIVEKGKLNSLGRALVFIQLTTFNQAFIDDLSANDREVYAKAVLTALLEKNLNSSMHILSHLSQHHNLKTWGIFESFLESLKLVFTNTGLASTKLSLRAYKDKDLLLIFCNSEPFLFISKNENGFKIQFLDYTRMGISLKNAATTLRTTLGPSFMAVLPSDEHRKQFAAIIDMHCDFLLQVDKMIEKIYDKYMKPDQQPKPPSNKLFAEKRERPENETDPSPSSPKRQNDN